MQTVPVLSWHTNDKRQNAQENLLRFCISYRMPHKTVEQQAALRELMLNEK